MADIAALDNALSGERTPPIADLLQSFSRADLEAAVARVTDTEQRVRLAAAWWPWRGFHKITVGEANTTLGRIFDASLSSPLSPYRSPPGKRARRAAGKAAKVLAAAAAEFDSDSEDEEQEPTQVRTRIPEGCSLTDKLLELQKLDGDLPLWLGFASARSLQPALAQAVAAELRSAAALLGLSTRGTKTQLGTEVYKKPCRRRKRQSRRAGRPGHEQRGPCREGSHRRCRAQACSRAGRALMRSRVTRTHGPHRTAAVLRANGKCGRLRLDFSEGSSRRSGARGPRSS